MYSPGVGRGGGGGGDDGYNDNYHHHNSHHSGGVDDTENIREMLGDAMVQDDMNMLTAGGGVDPYGVPGASGDPYYQDLMMQQHHDPHHYHNDDAYYQQQQQQQHSQRRPPPPDQHELNLQAHFLHQQQLREQHLQEQEAALKQQQLEELMFEQQLLEHQLLEEQRHLSQQQQQQQQHRNISSSPSYILRNMVDGGGSSRGGDSQGTPASSAHNNIIYNSNHQQQQQQHPGVHQIGMSPNSANNYLHPHHISNHSNNSSSHHQPQQIHHQQQSSPMTYYNSPATTEHMELRHSSSNGQQQYPPEIPQQSPRLEPTQQQQPDQQKQPRLRPRRLQGPRNASVKSFAGDEDDDDEYDEDYEENVEVVANEEDDENDYDDGDEDDDDGEDDFDADGTERNTENNDGEGSCTSNKEVPSPSRSLRVSGLNALGASVRNLMAAEDTSDPNYLYNLLEEALPKQQEVGRVLTLAEQQQRRDQIDQLWERVRRWCWAHTGDEKLKERQAAASVRGQASATCLHLICKLPNPPFDCVKVIVDAAPDVADNVDAHGWLPLHHACANGADPRVIQYLIDVYPPGILQQDKQMRTPLHFYATRMHAPDVLPATMARNAELLTAVCLEDDGGNSGMSAAQLADKNGMLPMHYACAYGTHPAVLQVMADAYPDSLTAKENNGRTPMHLAMVNAHRDASPDTIHFLLNFPAAKATINTRDQDGFLPLHLMTFGLKGFSRAESDWDKRNNVSQSLSLYLAAEPIVTADFLTAIKDMPEWLRDTAVVSKHVRNILNEKIVKRFPTSILMLDGYLLVIVIVCFAITTKNHIDMVFDPVNVANTSKGALIFLFIGAVYFILREIVQVLSLASIGSLNSWWKDYSNFLDLAIFILVTYYAVLMAIGTPGMSDEAFRAGIAVTQGLLWCSIILFLKKTLVDFAVFVGGVVYVVRRLVAFLLAVVVILLLFGQMFHLIYVDTDMCQPPPEEIFAELEETCSFPHCFLGTSILKVYTMMMGEIGDVTRYSTNFSAEIIFVFYAFVVIILLSTVLIAIVTDSYEIIQNDRAAIVFWSNRLDFVAEIDAISYAVKRRLKRGENQKKGGDGTKPSDDGMREAPVGAETNPEDLLDDDTELESYKDFFREGWHQVMMLFDDSLYDDIDLWESFIYNVFRIFCVFVIIPAWLAVGGFTAGWLWPPQVREYMFAQKETVISRAELERQKLQQLETIQDDLKRIKGEIFREMATDREEMGRMRVEVEKVQAEVLGDLQQVKELMTSLLTAGE